MKEEKGYRFNIGGASILLILVVLALSIFALLSVRASYHERKLAQKTSEAASGYYAADGTAEELYAAAAEAFKKSALNRDKRSAVDTADDTEAAPGLSQEEMLSVVLKALEDDGRAQNVAAEGTEIYYEVPVSEASRIVVKLNADMDGRAVLSVLSWKMVTEEQGDYGGAGLDIWDGEVE